jgi:hypothetical protein
MGWTGVGVVGAFVTGVIVAGETDAGAGPLIGNARLGAIEGNEEGAALVPSAAP